jgi:L-amino acid N-acyltransferase YncA
MIAIRLAQPEDFDAIWEIFHRVVQGGDTYVYDPGTTKDQARAIWIDSGTPYVALADDRIVGTYVLRANRPGFGAHVANASYMVSPDFHGRGIGKIMCEHSLEEARKAGFLAMQFNFVVSTNEAAVALWKKCGFQIVGTAPKAFRHKQLGLVDAFVMHRYL